MNAHMTPVPAWAMAKGAMTNTELAGVTEDTVMAITSGTLSVGLSSGAGALQDVICSSSRCC
ncbi:hypothetical protein D3C80_1674060 [compost metagenome]